MILNGILVKVFVFDGAQFYPEFGCLPSVIESGLVWCEYVDLDGGGWIQNSCADPFKDHWAILLASKEFCKEALEQFDSRCVLLKSEAIEAAAAIPGCQGREMDFGVLESMTGGSAFTCSCSNPACDLPNGFNCMNPL